MRRHVVSRLIRGLGLLLLPGLSAPAPAGESPEPAWLTNLWQLRQAAGQGVRAVHSFRIEASVLAVDFTNGTLVLRDASGTEFIRADFSDRDIHPGTAVCLEGRGCALPPRSFGLAIIPGMVVENDGVHTLTMESGQAFLPAGTNPITLQWFNCYRESGLSLEYEGPNLPRQRVPGSALLRAAIDGATGRTNFSAGLDYRCYEGLWEKLPDFGKYPPVKTGISTNFDLQVRTRDEAVGLQFNGFITLPRTGSYTFHLTSDDGSRLLVGNSFVAVRVLRQHPLPVPLAGIPTNVIERNGCPWITLAGTAAYAGVWHPGGELQLRVENDDVRVEVFADDSVPRLPLHGRVRVSGVYQDVVTDTGVHVPGRLRVLNWQAIQPAASAPASTAWSDRTTWSRPPPDQVPVPSELTVISNASEIKALSPYSAMTEYPVSIRGVITVYFSKYSGAVIQDSTRGLFVDLHNLPEVEPLQRGEFCQIEGVTGPGFFAPVVVARRIIHFGPGQLPNPRPATWEQLVNGSLDTEFAEIDGIVTAVHDRRMVLLTQGGKITLDLGDFQPAVLTGYAGAWVRIRGCFFANFNLETHKLGAGSMVVNGAAIEVLQPALPDPFAAPRKRIGELLFYDAKAAPFRLIKVSGQIIYARPGECFLTDGTNGMHVITQTTHSFAVGELVEAVGFLELGGPVAELREAILRGTGRAPLCPPVRLAPDRLLQATNAGLLVRVEATLMNQWREGAESVLELQSGFFAFKARINGGPQAVNLPPAGSRLELTGAYAPQGSRTEDGLVSGFELRLPAPADLKVLATPPWWTLKRLLALAGLLAWLLGLVLIWNKSLRRQVKERTRKWEAEIRQRQRAELQQAAAAERSRIARDLHDELGTGLTEVSLLASAGLGQFQDGEKIRDRFHAIAEKARALVSGLDVIVWAIDPRRNSLQAFADYLASYADELFAHSTVACHLRIQIEPDPVAFAEAERHSLFLAVKEALNNVLCHAAATAVELQVFQLGGQLHIVIADDGRGFDWQTIRRGNGLTNLQERLAAMQGQCHIESRPGSGTTVKFIVPCVPNQSN